MRPEELMDPQNAVEFLSRCLAKGTLTLFLGAGSSSGMGLPGWGEFINNLLLAKGFSPVDPKSDSLKLQTSADTVERACSLRKKEYLSLVKKFLYEGVMFNSDLLKNDLLIALSALLIGSKRGNISRVVTLNFDSTLEWVLSTYGFTFRAVSRLPELEGSEDVRIYHPHGFLPHPSMKNMMDSETVILGFDSVNQRLGDNNDPWNAVMRHLSRSGVFLFVGLSERTFQDRSITPLLTATWKDLQESRPVGIWILKEKPQERDIFLRSGVAPIVLDSNKKISDFLLSVCQLAYTYCQV